MTPNAGVGTAVAGVLMSRIGLQMGALRRDDNRLRRAWLHTIKAGNMLQCGQPLSGSLPDGRDCKAIHGWGAASTRKFAVGWTS